MLTFAREDVPLYLVAAAAAVSCDTAAGFGAISSTLAMSDSANAPRPLPGPQCHRRLLMNNLPLPSRTNSPLNRPNGLHLPESVTFPCGFSSASRPCG